MKNFFLLSLLWSCCVFAQQLTAQGSPDYQGGFKIKLNDNGSKYIRIISWAQVQANLGLPNTTTNDINFGFNLRRARVLMFAQITDKFLILTHFGQNSLTAATMSPTGKGEGSQLFFHDVWIQYNVHKNHTIGAGLHYFNGISRLNNQSTLNMMTLDNNRQSWATIGLSDQFARHLGVFGKGSFGNFQYRLAINNAAQNGLDGRDPIQDVSSVYGGSRILGMEASLVYAGYFEYQLWDRESNFLPYKVGTYLGSKKVLNIGAGFFLHPNGSVRAVNAPDNYQGELVNLWAIDAFMELPIGEKNACLTAYATFQLNNYGKDYLFSAYGTGNMIYAHVGYAFPGEKLRFQPYVSFGTHAYQALPDQRNVLSAGLNMYMNGHHSKLTLEYRNQSFGVTNSNTLSLQAMVYL
ncbi:MAG: hypothetical protein ACRBFS_22305 [Aureispira sp.]